MRVLFVQTRGFINGQGGTEKICSFLANEFVKTGHHVEIATNDIIEGKNVFYLDAGIVIHNVYNPQFKTIELCNISSYTGKNLFTWIKHKVIKKCKKIVNNLLLLKYGSNGSMYLHNLSQRSKMWTYFFGKKTYDLIVTMSIESLLEITYQNTISAPIINSTNGRPDYDYTNLLWFRSPEEQQLLKDAYKKLIGIQVLFESYRNFIPETFNGLCKVIPNSVVQQESLCKETNTREKNIYKIIHIGSLVTSCKQQHVAIEVFSRIINKFQNWELHLWGTGNDEQFLENLIQEKNLQDRAYLNGFTENPINQMLEADIFIFPSKYEGFPLALLEAMSVGLPALGFSNCSGVNELIIDNQTGFLCKDIDDMIVKMEVLMRDIQLRYKFGLRAREESLKYNPNRVAEDWILFSTKAVESFNLSKLLSKAINK